MMNIIIKIKDYRKLQNDLLPLRSEIKQTKFEIQSFLAKIKSFETEMKLLKQEVGLAKGRLHFPQSKYSVPEEFCNRSYFANNEYGLVHPDFIGPGPYVVDICKQFSEEKPCYNMNCLGRRRNWTYFEMKLKYIEAELERESMQNDLINMYKKANELIGQKKAIKKNHKRQKNV